MRPGVEGNLFGAYTHTSWPANQGPVGTTPRAGPKKLPERGLSPSIDEHGAGSRGESSRPLDARHPRTTATKRNYNQNPQKPARVCEDRSEARTADRPARPHKIGAKPRQTSSTHRGKEHGRGRRHASRPEHSAEDEPAIPLRQRQPCNSQTRQQPPHQHNRHQRRHPTTRTHELSHTNLQRLYQSGHDAHRKTAHPARNEVPDSIQEEQSRRSSHIGHMAIFDRCAGIRARTAQHVQCTP